MIIVNLKGGLGNQMFQYAFGRSLSVANDVEMKIDVKTLLAPEESGNIERPFSINQFNIATEIATEAEINKIKPQKNWLQKNAARISHKLFGDQTVMFNKKYTEVIGDTYFDGYWQSPLYFNEIRDQLLSEFALKEALSQVAQDFNESIQSSTSVSLHVRRGDYATNTRVLREFGVCSIDYYKTAIAHIKSKVTSPRFFIFSDDIAWVKENLDLDASATYVKDSAITDTMELVLMSQCQHNIIANSSFSWWGAWLNQNPEKIVVAPKPWFNITPYDKNLIPGDWIQLQK